MTPSQDKHPQTAQNGSPDSKEIDADDNLQQLKQLKTLTERITNGTNDKSSDGNDRNSSSSNLHVTPSRNSKSEKKQMFNASYNYNSTHSSGNFKSKYQQFHYQSPSFANPQNIPLIIQIDNIPIDQKWKQIKYYIGGCIHHTNILEGMVLPHYQQPDPANSKSCLVLFSSPGIAQEAVYKLNGAMWNNNILVAYPLAMTMPLPVLQQMVVPPPIPSLPFSSLPLTAQQQNSRERSQTRYFASHPLAPFVPPGQQQQQPFSQGNASPLKFSDFHSYQYLESRPSSGFPAEVEVSSGSDSNLLTTSATTGNTSPVSDSSSEISRSTASIEHASPSVQAEQLAYSYHPTGTAYAYYSLSPSENPPIDSSYNTRSQESSQNESQVLRGAPPPPLPPQNIFPMQTIPVFQSYPPPLSSGESETNISRNNDEEGKNNYNTSVPAPHDTSSSGQPPFMPIMQPVFYQQQPDMQGFPSVPGASAISGGLMPPVGIISNDLMFQYQVPPFQISQQPGQQQQQQQQQQQYPQMSYLQYGNQQSTPPRVTGGGSGANAGPIVSPMGFPYSAQVPHSAGMSLAQEFSERAFRTQMDVRGMKYQLKLSNFPYDYKIRWKLLKDFIKNDCIAPVYSKKQIATQSSEVTAKPIIKYDLYVGIYKEKLGMEDSVFMYKEADVQKVLQKEGPDIAVCVSEESSKNFKQAEVNVRDFERNEQDREEENPDLEPDQNMIVFKAILGFNDKELMDTVISRLPVLHFIIPGCHLDYKIISD